MKYIKNPIIETLFNLNLIKKKNLIKLSNNTRDKKIKVFQDKISKIIFLEKFFIGNNYSKIAMKDFSKIKVKGHNLKIRLLRNDNITRRYNDFKKYFKNKNILDFGAGWGGFLSKIKNKKSITAFELRPECINYLKKINIKVVNKFKDLKDNHYEFVSLFHVFEHIPDQISTLKKIYSKMKKGGKLILEVPHANDLLIKTDIKQFKDFIFWSQHLILHTEKSLYKFLKLSKFKKVKFICVQRYNFSNHIKWIIEKKPSGHEGYLKINKTMNKEYENFLVKNKLTDTIIAVATK